MNTQVKLIKGKVGLLKLAEELGNVSQACKLFGYSRDSFYRFKELYEQGGELGLQEISRIRAVKGTNETERITMQWGFLPRRVQSHEAITRFRNGYKDANGRYIRGYTTLNATSEELLNGLYKEAALQRRCLVPSTGFYEWMHVQVVGKSGKLLKTPEKFPYLVQMQNQEEFYIAGIWQPCFVEDVRTTINTFAITTAPANVLMKQIHNSKERMPTILPADIAEAWLHKDLSEQDIMDISNYQIAAAEMKATPLHKDFLKRTNPHEPVIYQEVPKLVYK